MTERLRKYLDQTGMSARELAAVLGDVSRGTTSRWVNGEAVPDANQMSRLAEVFGVTVGEMYGEAPGENLSEDERKAVELMRTLGLTYKAVLNAIRDRISAEGSAEASRREKA